MIVCWRISAHSAVVERAGLVQDRVGHGDLADVVQLGGAHEHVERLGVQAERGGRRPAARSATPVEWSSRSGSRSAITRTSRSRAWPREPPRRRRLRAYMRASASRSASVASPASSGSTTRPCDAVTEKPSPCSLSAPTARATSGASSSQRAFDEQAELVAAEPVGAPADGGQRGRQAAQQRVPGRVAERVVVVLEAVEVEEDERVAPAPGRRRRGRRRAPAGSAARSACPSSPRAASCARARSSGAASASPGPCRRTAPARRARPSAAPRCTSPACMSTEIETAEQTSGTAETLQPTCAGEAGRRGLPGGQRDQGERQRPHRVQPRAGAVGARGLLVDVERVGQRAHGEAGAEHRPAAAGPPAGGGERDAAPPRAAAGRRPGSPSSWPRRRRRPAVAARTGSKITPADSAASVSPAWMPSMHSQAVHGLMRVRSSAARPT